MSTENIIVIKDLEFAYESGNPVLSDINLEISNYQLTCIVGPNGGGKTTLVNLILGLLTPQRGTIRVLGQSPVKAREKIGYMPQYFNLDSNFPITVLEVVLMGCLHQHFWGRYSRDDRRQAMAALERIQLQDYAEVSFASLSGGQRQRVLIARALVTQPQLLLLDEPTANVDPSFQDEFYTLLSKLKHDMAVIVVSHDISFVSQHVDHVLCVNHGVHIHPTTLFDNTPLKEIYNFDVNLIRHDHCDAVGHHHDRQNACCRNQGDDKNA